MVSIAPSIRRALHQRTAKEPPTPVNGVYGKFWDPDSDSEYEDLGDADDLARGVVVPPPRSSSLHQPRRSTNTRRSRAVCNANRRSRRRLRHPQRPSVRRGRGYGKDLFRRVASHRWQRLGTSSSRLCKGGYQALGAGLAAMIAVPPAGIATSFVEAVEILHLRGFKFQTRGPVRLDHNRSDRTGHGRRLRIGSPRPMPHNRALPRHRFCVDLSDD